MKIALIHDFLLEYGGAERFLESIISIYPNADVFTLAFDKKKFPDNWQTIQIKTLVNNKLPLLKKYPQIYAAYLMSKIEQLDLSKYDIVICSDIIFAKCVQVPVKTKLICYQYSPSDMLYGFISRVNEKNIFKIILTGWQKYILRQREFIAANKVDRFLTSSQHTAKRVIKYYRREPEVFYPAVKNVSVQEIERLKDNSNNSYYLVLGRLVADKRIDLAIEACNSLKINLVIAGVGDEENKLKVIAGKTVSFVGYVNDEERARLMVNCKALLFLNEEDFGYTPVECQAYGKGVIAYSKGGVKETVIEGVTGTFFADQNKENVVEAINRFKNLEIRSEACLKQASLFSLRIFKMKFQSLVDEVLAS